MKDFLHKNRNLLIALLLDIICLYLLPLMTPNSIATLRSLILDTPLGLFIAGLWLGSKQGFSWQLVVGSVVLFVPTVWLYYNESAWGYVIVYGIMTALGLLVGSFIYARNLRKKRKL